MESDPSSQNGTGDEDDSSATTTATAANVFLRRLMPSCLARRSTLAELRDDEDSSLSHLDLVDEELGTVHRSIMARTRQKGPLHSHKMSAKFFAFFTTCHKQNHANSLPFVWFLINSTH